MVLGGADRDRGRAVAERKQARLLADEALLDDELGPGLASAPPSMSSMAPSASATLAATTTPLPAASPSALTTIGAPSART